MKQFTPPGDLARIYVYREPGGFLAHTGVLPVTVDGLVVGALTNGTYLTVDVAPGTHVISSQTVESFTQQNVVAKQGEPVFLKQGTRMGLLSARVSLEQVSAEAGRGVVLRDKLTTATAIEGSPARVVAAK